MKAVFFCSFLIQPGYYSIYFQKSDIGGQAQPTTYLTLCLQEMHLLNEDKRHRGQCQCQCAHCTAEIVFCPSQVHGFGLASGQAHVPSMHESAQGWTGQTRSIGYPRNPDYLLAPYLVWVGKSGFLPVLTSALAQAAQRGIRIDRAKRA